jgi:hypothetical protein
MDCDPPKSKQKHRISRKESSRALAPVFPSSASKEPQSVIVQPSTTGISSAASVTGKKYRNRKPSPLSRTPSPAVSVITISSESDEDKQARALKNTTSSRTRGHTGSNFQGHAGTADMGQPSPLVPSRTMPNSAGQSPSAFLPINDAQVSSSTQRNQNNQREQDVSSINPLKFPFNFFMLNFFFYKELGCSFL